MNKGASMSRAGMGPHPDLPEARLKTFCVKTPMPAKSALLPPPPGKAPGIVSSSHLVSPRSVQLSEFEFGLIVAWNAFSRWAVRCMAAAGMPDLTITDVLLLHHLCHRARDKKLADIGFMLNYEDTHVVAYSLKKLVAAGLASTPSRARRSTTVPRQPARRPLSSTVPCARNAW
jgi:hypothetical protein